MTKYVTPREAAMMGLVYNLAEEQNKPQEARKLAQRFCRCSNLTLSETAQGFLDHYKLNLSHKK